MEIKQAIDALGALAQDTRLAVFRLLVSAGMDGLPAGTIAERLGAPTSTLSFHLAYLNRAGLVVSRRDGRSIIYSANFEGMRELLEFLTQDCCAGRPEMCNLPSTGPKPAYGRAGAKRRNFPYQSD